MGYQTMKPITPPTLKLFGLLALLIVLQSCDPGKPGYWKNEQINAGKRADFHQLNEAVFKDLKANDPKHLQSMMSKEMIDDPSNNRVIELISNRLNSNVYSLYDEYYVVNKWRSRDTIVNTSHAINSYNLHYHGAAREMYITYYLPKTGDNKFMITVIYSKYDYGWKLSKLDLEQYTVNGKTAPELFERAKKMEAKSYFSDAATTMVLAHDCLAPSDIWQYPDDSLITGFYIKALQKANSQFKFPLIVSQVPTHPRIYRIANQSMDAGTYPMIYYLTSIKLKDTAAVKKENEAIKKVIGQVIPGIDKDKKYLLYGAFNERTTGLRTVDRYEVVDKLK